MSSNELMKMLGGAEADAPVDEAASDAATGPVKIEIDAEDQKATASAPKSKAEVHKMTGPKLDALETAGLLGDLVLKGMTVAQKKEAVIKVFWPNDNALTEDEVGDDKLTGIAKDIEQLKDQKEIEGRIDVLLDSEGLNDFQMGGLFSRLKEVGDFAPSKNFADYVLSRFGIKYRKAQYMIDIYAGLLNAGIAWDKVKKVGWTKLKEIVGILTKDNVDEWVAKAAAMNTDSLIKAVESYVQATANGTNASEAPSSTLKSKTFKFGEDQLETVNGAIEKAKKISGTQVDSVAMEHIALEFLGAAPSGSADKVTKDALAKATKELGEAKVAIEELTEQITNTGNDKTEVQPVKMPTPKEFYTHMLQINGGSVPTTIKALFGEDSGFAETFPSLDLSIKKKVAA